MGTERDIKLISSVPLHEDQLERLRAVAPGIVVRSDGFRRRAAEFAELFEPDATIVYSTAVPADMLERLPDLKWLQLQSAGCNHILDHPVMDSSAIVTTCSGIHATPIAEYCITMLLSLFRGLPELYRAQVDHRWIPQDVFVRSSRELRGRTIGIIGYGAIGREVARLAKAFGTDVIAVKRDASTAAAEGSYMPEGVGDPLGELPDRVFAPDQLLDMLPHCEAIVLAVPLTDQTRGMIGRRELEAMKPGSYIVNVARGAVVDESAMIEALKNGRLGGAALDVVGEEPLPAESELWDMPNVLLTPHISGGSRPYQRRAFEVLIENLKRFVADEPLLNRVDRSAGY